MSDGFDLKQFLEENAADGVLDSEGGFTLSHDKALKKLASFLLPDDYDWVLKLTQAANTWRCPTLDVKQTRVATSFTFCPPEGNFPEEYEIVEALRRGQLDKHNPVDLLCMALRSLVEQASLSFVLAVSFGQKSSPPIYAGDDTTSLDESTRREWTHLEQRGLRLTVSHFRGNESFHGRYLPTAGRVERRDLLIADKLVRSAYASATKIFVDKRELSDLFADHHIGSNRIWRPLGTGVLGEPHEWNALPMKERADRLKRPARSQTFEQPWLFLRSVDWLFYEFAEGGLPAELHLHNHQVFWIAGGVVVGRSEVPRTTLATTAYLFIPANDLRLDLPGLNLVHNEESRARLTQVLTAARNLLGDLTEKGWKIHAKEDQLETAESDTQAESAGFSIFTESLTDLIPNLRRLDNSVRRLVTTLVNAPRLGSLRKKWDIFVKAELEELERDFRKLPQPNVGLLQSESERWR